MAVVEEALFTEAIRIGSANADIANRHMLVAMRLSKAVEHALAFLGSGRPELARECLRRAIDDCARITDVAAR